MIKWYADRAVDHSVIISSRVRLARNVKKYRFNTMAKPEELQNMIQEAAGAIKNNRTYLSEHFEHIDMSGKDSAIQWSYLERHILSPEFLKHDKPKALLLQDDERVSIMLNEEDHIRIQAISPGDDMDSSWEMADKIDDLIEESLEYAFDKDYGYLTSCPTNTGTGLRASFMVHLPMLERTGQLKHILPVVSKFGMTLRGIYGEGTEPQGGIYQISNQVTMGKSEGEIINSLKNVTTQIIDRENIIREKVLSERRIELEDLACRAFGILTHCRQISAKEAMHLLSDLRLGIISGVISALQQTTIYNMMMNIQIGNLQINSGRVLDESGRDAARAEYLRETLKK